MLLSSHLVLCVSDVLLIVLMNFNVQILFACLFAVVIFYQARSIFFVPKPISLRTTTTTVSITKTNTTINNMLITDPALMDSLII